MMHTTQRPTAACPSPLGAEIDAARRAGVPWKLLERRYGLSRARLDQIWGEFKGRHHCACPNCGHAFDPKRIRARARPGPAADGDGERRIGRHGREAPDGSTRTET